MTKTITITDDLHLAKTILDHDVFGHVHVAGVEIVIPIKKTAAMQMLRATQENAAPIGGYHL